MAESHAFIAVPEPHEDGAGTITARVGLADDDGTRTSTTASYPFGPYAATGDRESLEALIRVLNWYKSEYSWVGSRTYEIHQEGIR